MEQKKVQEKAKREHRRVMMAVDEFLKVGRNVKSNYSFLWHNVRFRTFTIKGLQVVVGNIDFKLDTAFEQSKITEAIA